MKHFFTSIAVIVLFIAAGCSGSTQSPVSPIDAQIPIAESGTDNSGLLFEGTFEIDLDTMQITNMENRQSNLVYNITGFLPDKCPGGCFRFRIVGLVGSVLEIELTIENPVDVAVYDMRIQYTNLFGKTVLNPDSYTDFFGTPLTQIYPFTAFAKDAPNRAFPVGPGVVETETMYLDFPPGAPAAVNYAITASLPGNTLEPYEISDMSQIGSLTPSGGSAVIRCKVLDHQNDISQVWFDARQLMGVPVQMMHAVQEHYYVADVTNSLGVPVGVYSGLIMAVSPNSQSINTYNYVTISISDDSSETPNWTQFQYNVSHGGRREVIGPQTNNVAWIFSGPGTNATNVIEGHDGTLYYGTIGNAGRVEAVNPDGSHKWTYFPSVSASWNKPLGVSADNTIVYAGLNTESFKGNVVGINSANGEELWITSFMYYVSANTYGLILENGDLVVSGQDDLGYSTARFDKNGNQIWRAQTNWNWCTAPAQGQNGLIYAKSGSAKIVGLNPNTGNEEYSVSFDEPGLNTQQSLAVRSDGSVVFAGNLGSPTETKIWCFDAELNKQWDLILGPGIPIDGFGIGSNDEIYFTVFDSSYSHILYAVNPDGTGLLWTYRGVKQWTSPIVDADGTIYCGLNLGIVALNPDGTEKWVYNGTAYAGSPAISQDGSLYANMGGDLYKFADL